MWGGGAGAGRHADDLSLSQKGPRRGNRDLQRPSDGDVLCDSGIESPGNKNQESVVREEDVSEFLPETGGVAAARSGRGNSGCENRQTVDRRGTVCTLTPYPWTLPLLPS